MRFFSVFALAFGLNSLNLIRVASATQAIMHPTLPTCTLDEPFTNSLRASTIAMGSQKCRCISGDSCWPTESEWNLLNTTVGGRLIATSMLADVCHDPNYNATACNDLIEAWDLEATQ